MSVFEFTMIALAVIYVASSLYFSITGRVFTERREEKEDERFSTQMDVEQQLKVLTTRIGEVSSENNRLNNVVRSWMAAANDYKTQLDVALKEKEEWKKEAIKLQGDSIPKKMKTKKGGE